MAASHNAYGVLSAANKHLTSEIMKAYDTDGSGAIEANEFASMCRAYDVHVDPVKVAQLYNALAGPNGVAIDGVAAWLSNTFGTGEASYSAGVSEMLRNSGSGINAILPRHRQAASVRVSGCRTTDKVKASELFRAYDQDASSFIDLAEFTGLCRAYDPSIDAAGVAQTFQMVNATDGRIDLAAFFRWTDMMFGDCTDQEFNEGMHDMMAAATTSAQSPASAAARAKTINTHGLSRNCRAWADKLFGLYDADQSGDMSMHEFTTLCKKFDPNMTESSVKATFEAVGAKHNKITLEQFYAWCKMVFGDDELDMEDGLRELLASSGAQVNQRMTSARKASANVVYDAFDSDHSGTMTLSEFAALYILIDSMCTMDVIQKQFETTGCETDMDREAFERWIFLQFNDLSDQEFSVKVNDLVAGAAKINRTPRTAQKMGSPATAQQDAALQSRLGALQAEISRNEKTQAQLKQQSAQEQSKLKELQEQQRRTMTENQKFREKAEREKSQLDQQLSEQRAQAKKNEADLVPLSQRKRELQAGVERNQEEVAKMEDKLKQLTADVNFANSEYTDKQSAVMNSARQMEMSQQKLQEMDDRIKDLNADVATRSLRSEELKREIERLEAEKQRRQMEESHAIGDRTAREAEFNSQISTLNTQQRDVNDSLERQQKLLVDAQTKLTGLLTHTSGAEQAAAEADQKRQRAEQLLKLEEAKLANVQAEVEARIKASRGEAEAKAEAERLQAEEEAQLQLEAIATKAKTDQAEIQRKVAKEAEEAAKHASEMMHKSKELLTAERTEAEHQASQQTAQLRQELQAKVEAEELAVQRELEETRNALKLKHSKEREALEGEVAKQLSDLEKQKADMRSHIDAELAKQKVELQAHSEAETRRAEAELEAHRNKVREQQKLAEALAQKEIEQYKQESEQLTARGKAEVDRQVEELQRENEERLKQLTEQQSEMKRAEEEAAMATSKLHKEKDAAAKALGSARKSHDDEVAKQQAKRLEMVKQVAELEAKAKILEQDVSVGKKGTLVGSKIAQIQAAAASTQGSLGELGGKLDALKAEVQLGEANTRTALLDAVECKSYATNMSDHEAELEKVLAQAAAAELAAQKAREAEKKRWASAADEADKMRATAEQRASQSAEKLQKVTAELESAEEKKAELKKLDAQVTRRKAEMNELVAEVAAQRASLAQVQAKLAESSAEVKEFEEVRATSEEVAREERQKHARELEKRIDEEARRIAAAQKAVDDAEAKAAEVAAQQKSALRGLEDAETRKAAALAEEKRIVARQEKLADDEGTMAKKAGEARAEAQTLATQVETQKMQLETVKDQLKAAAEQYAKEEEAVRRIKTQRDEDEAAREKARQAGVDQNSVEVQAAREDAVREKHQREAAEKAQSEAEAKLMEAEGRVREAEQTKEQAEADAASQVEAAKAAEAKVLEAEAQTAALQAERDAALKAKADAEANVQDAESGIAEAYRRKEEALSLQSAQTQESLSEATKARETTQRAAIEAQEEASEARKQCASAQAAREVAEMTTKKLRQEHDAMAQRVQEAEKAAAEAKAAASAMQVAKEHAEKAAAEAFQVNEDIVAGRLGAHSSEVERLSAQQSKMVAQLDSTEGQRKELETSVEAQRVEEAKLNVKLQVLREELEGLETKSAQRRAPAVVESSMRLNMDMGALREPAARKSFERTFALDVASSLGVSLDTITVTGLTAGSVIVDFQLRYASEPALGAPSLLELATKLQAQVADTDSPLYKGTVTRNTDPKHVPALRTKSAEETAREQTEKGSRATAELELVCVSVEEKKTELKALESKIGILRDADSAEQQGLVASVEEHRIELQMLAEKMHTSQSELVSLQAACSEGTEELDLLQRRVAELKAESSRWEEVVAQRKRAAAEDPTSPQARSVSPEKRQSMTAERRRAETGEGAELQRQREALREEVEHLERRRTELSMEVDAKRRSVGSPQSGAAELPAVVEGLQEQRDGLERDCREKSEVVAQLKRRSAELSQELEVKEAELASMGDMRVHVAHGAIAASQAGNDVESGLHRLRADRAEIEGVVMERRRESEALAARISAQQVELAKLETSTSTRANSAMANLQAKQEELYAAEHKVDQLQRSANDAAQKVELRRQEFEALKPSTPAAATPGTPAHADFYTPGTPPSTIDQNADMASAGDSSMSPIERRKSRLLALRKRLQDQYGSPPSSIQSSNTNTPAAPSAVPPSPGKEGEKSFDDLVNVCIRLREELDEQRSALLAEFSTAGANP